MVTATDQVFNELRAGKSPTDLRLTFKSSSKRAKGFQMYFDWADPEITGLQSSISSLKNTEENLKKSVKGLQDLEKNLNEEKRALTLQRDKLLEETREKSENLVNLQKQTRQADDTLTSLQSETKKLEDKGYTSEIMLVLSKSDVTSGGEMLQRVQTVEKYDSENQILEQTRVNLANENQEATTKKNDLDAKIQKAESDFKEAEDRLRNLKEVVDKISVGIETARNEGQKAITSLHDTTKASLESLVDESRKIVKALRSTRSQTLSEVKDSVTTVRDEALETGKMMSKLEAMAPLFKLIDSAEGKPSEVYDVVHLVCHKFKFWTFKYLRSNPTVTNATDDLMKKIEEEMKTLRERTNSI